MRTYKTTTKKKLRGTIIDLLINVSLFDGLNSDELSVVADHMNLIELSKDEILFEEGDKGDYLCFVVDGWLNILKSTAKGTHALIATLSRGRSIGEMSIIDNTPRSATVKARTNSILLTLSAKSFEAILDNFPRIGIKILKELAKLLSLNMRRTSSRLADYMELPNSQNA